MSKAFRKSGKKHYDRIDSEIPEPLLSKKSNSKTALMAVLLLVVCTSVTVTHWPALSARALSFDDGEYLVENLLVQNPGFNSAKRFLTEVLRPSTVRGYYQPLAMITLMTDYALGGRPDNLTQFHLTSLVLHVANTALIIVLLYLLFGQPWAAAALGLLFGLHPMTVETIPWVGERKTLLSAFFALWSLILYVRFSRKTSLKLYFGCLLMYVLAVMSKPISLPLPALMLLMDYWPMRRLNRRLVLEKIPFFAVMVLFAGITFLSQGFAGGVKHPSQYGPMGVPLILCHNIIFYLHHIFWPVNLSSHYPFPQPFDLSNPHVLAGVVGTCVFILLLLISLRWTRAALTGWLIFFAAILPSMQIIGFSVVIASDKFVYLPSIGLLMIAASFLSWLLTRKTFKKNSSKALLIAIVLILAGFEYVLTRQYLMQWKDTTSLCKYMLSMTPDAAPLHDMLGNELKAQGKMDEAMTEYRKAMQFNSNNASAYLNLGTVLKEQGRLDEAIFNYKKVLEMAQGKPNYSKALYNLGLVFEEQGNINEAINSYLGAIEARPSDFKSHNNLGNLLKSKGRLDEAERHFRVALQINPNFVQAYFNLGVVLRLQGRIDEAIKQYSQALQIQPDANTQYNIGNAFQSQGKIEQAIYHYIEAIRLKPDFVEAEHNIGNSLQALGRFDEAILHYRQALKFKPDDIEANYNLGLALAAINNINEAVEHFREAIKLKPDWAAPLNTAALVLVTLSDANDRNVREAIDFAERAAKLTDHKSAVVLDTLAIAYSTAGRFEEATTAAQKAFALASAAQANDLASEISRQIELYKQRKPYQKP